MTGAASQGAVLVGQYQIVVTHMDGSSETFSGFATHDQAKDWAMRNRETLGLTRCAWRVDAVE